MPRRSIFGEAKVRKVECRSKRQLDYAETKLNNTLRRLCPARVEAFAYHTPPLVFSSPLLHLFFGAYTLSTPGRRLSAARAEASARGGPPMAFSAGFAPQRTE